MVLALVDQLFHYLVKQPIRAYGASERTRLQQAFAERSFNLQKLVVDIVATSAVTPAAEKPKSST